MSRKLRTYLIGHCWLWRCRPEHRGNNRNRQFYVLVRAPSKKWIAEQLDTTVHQLSHAGFNVRDDMAHLVPKDLTFYYQVEPPNPDAFKWFEYDLPQRPTRTTCPTRPAPGPSHPG